MPDIPDDLAAALTAAASDVMTVDAILVGDVRPFRQSGPPARTAKRRGPRTDPMLALAVASLRGRLLLPAHDAYDCLAERLHALDLTAVLRRGEADGEAVLLALPGKIITARPNVRLAAILFVATVFSCLFVGAQMPEAVAVSGKLNLNLLDGVPYAASLLAILLAHEFGHYITARRLGAPVSLPYFLPLPIPGATFGTLGAVINMYAPPRDRRQLLAVGAAGPLAGLLVTIPVLWYGLSISHLGPLTSGAQLEGNSILYALLKYLYFGRLLPAGGVDVWISPVATAGWVGLFITALNLIPAGQLDGGHIAFALLGERWANRLLYVVLAALAALSFLWPGWILWVVLVFVFSRLPQTPLDDLSTLTPRQRALSVMMLLIFVLVFIPIPFTIIP